jgi:hypothetical protein
MFLKGFYSTGDERRVAYILHSAVQRSNTMVAETGGATYLER